MLNFKKSCLVAASSLAVAVIVTIDAPEAEAAVQQAEDQLLGASLQSSGDITIAQNDGRRGGRGDGARGGRRGGGEGSRGGRGGNRGGNVDDRLRPAVAGFNHHQGHYCRQARA